MTAPLLALLLSRWIEPHWGHYLISEVRTVAVEQWHHQLTLDQERKMARGTRAKIRSVMHSLFNHAIRWEWLTQNTNPIAKVRQSAKREQLPQILEVDEIQALLHRVEAGRNRAQAASHKGSPCS